MHHFFKLGLISTAVLSSQIALANEFWSQDRQWLLGDWGGERQQLENKGYKFTASIMSQAATNLDGGYNDSNTLENAGQLTLGANFDLNKIAGWEDTTAAIMITKRDGNALTLERIKDPRSSALGNSQEIYGRGKIWRLTQAWIKKVLMTIPFKSKLVVWACQMISTAHNANFKIFYFVVGSLENRLVRSGTTGKWDFGAQM